MARGGTFHRVTTDRQTWEYLIWNPAWNWVPASGDSPAFYKVGGQELPSVVAVLNHYGARGWELVSAWQLSAPDWHYEYTFKRPAD